MAEQLRPLGDFLQLVRMEAPGAADVLAIQALRLSAADYCKKTRCWRHAITVQMDADGDDPVVVPDHTSLYQIESALWGDDRDPITPIAYTDVMDDWQLTEAGNYKPDFITMTSTNTVTVLPKIAGTLHLSVFLTPIVGPSDLLGPSAGGVPAPYDDINRVPNFLFTDHAETIASGALYRLLRIPNMPFTNPEMAAAHFTMFNEAADRASNVSITGKQRARKRARPIWY
jgi:hypothetical protein